MLEADDTGRPVVAGENYGSDPLDILNPKSVLRHAMTIAIEAAPPISAVGPNPKGTRALRLAQASETYKPNGKRERQRRLKRLGIGEDGR